MVMSLDGRKEINDKMRPFRKGAGSYDLIVPKFQKFAKSGGRRIITCGERSRETTWTLLTIVLHFADLGFEQMSIEAGGGGIPRKSTPSARKIFR